MLQFHGKTRRGRPPKYQQYWISLAMEKAAQRALENGQGQNGEAVNAGTDKPALKDDSAIIEARLQQENSAGNRRDDKNADQLPLKRRSNSWPLNENVKDGIEGTTNHCNPLLVHQIPLRNNSSDGAGTREDFQTFKKFKPNDFPNRDHVKSSNVLQSTWNEKILGCEVPFLVAAPFKHVTKGIVVQTSESGPPDAQHASSKARNVFPGMSLDHTGFVRTDSYLEGRGHFYDGGHVHFVTTEKSDHALDLSSKLVSTEGSNNNFKHAVSVENPSQPKIPQDSRQILNIVQPWNTGHVPEEIQALNADKGSLKPENDGYSVQPMLRSFPFSHFAEVSLWTVDEVVQFVTLIPGCHEYAECFREEDIDGSSLLQLSESHLRNIIRMKLGPSLHLKKALDDLASYGANAAA